MNEPAPRAGAAGPRVSVCVPNLDTRAYLPERFETIRAQTFGDWELLVYDSHSTDGAWEYIRQVCDAEPRMRAWQGPREGTPGSWTPCVRQARGEYVYVATSDDTMAPDLLERLVHALDTHPECDLAHCSLKVVDERGEDVPGTTSWWSAGSAFAASSGALMHVPHVRLAPFDGLLHLLGGSVYVSITQLLIRRSLFDRIGYFTSTWGSVGDFNWAMRAGLAANTVHVPGTWGGWRVHSAQATAGVRLQSREHARKVDAMIDDAVFGCLELLPPNVRGRLTSRWLAEAAELRAFTREAARRSTRPLALRAGRTVGQLCMGSAAAREYVLSRLLGRAPADWVRRRLAAIGCWPCLIPTDASADSRPPASPPASVSPALETV